MNLLLIGDCLEEVKNVDDNSVDLIFCDLPYGQISCKWDCIIDLDKLWIEFMRIKKLNTPIIMTCTTKFGVSLINSCPKKCPFRYDLVWCKSASAGFLCAKKMPMRKHEMIYVFYEKLPFYDLSSHKHKFVKEEEDVKIDVAKDGAYGKGINIINPKDRKDKYKSPLPTSLIKEDCPEPEPEYIQPDTYGKNSSKEYNNNYAKKQGYNKNQVLYDPPLPTSLLEIKSTRGKHSTEKPVNLMKWILKYYSKEGDNVFDPTMGSGSMGVACKEMNRNFIGIEKDPEIYEVAVNRIAE
jgi:site-specific DNA-methyltransferase (adenine-specific)